MSKIYFNRVIAESMPFAAVPLAMQSAVLNLALAWREQGKLSKAAYDRLFGQGV